MSPALNRPIQIALLVAGAFFMENLDGTVIATALPQMARSFGVSPVDLNVGMTAYLLTLAVFIPVSGWVADRFGPREVFAIAIAIFTVASICCGFSNSVASFTIARVVQGLGGAMMVPVGRLVVLRTTERRNLMRSMAYITWPGLAAPVVGPALGGFITQALSWRWIFFLNVPLGLLGLALAVLLIPNTRQTAPARFDFFGFALTAVACAGLLYGLDLAGSGATPWIIVTSLIAAGCLAATLANWHMRRTPHPLFDLSTLRIPTFAMSVYGGSLFRIAISTIPFLLPLLFQVGFGLDPFKSGLLVLSVFAGNLSMKALAMQVLRRFGFRQVLIVNGIFAAVMLAACALLAPDTPTAVMVAVLFVGGLTRSMQFSALTTLGFVDVPQAQMSAANAVTSMLYQLNAGFGIALGAVALRASAAIAGRQDTTLVDFRFAFGLAALVALAAALSCLGLQRDAGADVSGHRIAGAGSAGSSAKLPGE